MSLATTDGDPGQSTGGHRTRRGTVPILLGTLLVVAAAGWAGYSWLWTRHAEQVGRQLIAAHELHLRGSAGRQLAAACASGTSGSAGTDPVQGVLSIPAIDVQAPVENGDGDAVLAVAVGHVPTSVWPGTTGTAVLAAHDVSYFVGIDKLADGAVIDYQTPCTTYHFAVSGHLVVRQGSPLYNSAGPTLVLETCWPTDALWYTPDRYLVTATEVGSTPTSTAAAAAGGRVSATSNAAARPPVVAAPAALAAQGLTLATNSIPMGTLTEVGDPQPSWVDSPAPLAVEGSALQAFIGDLRSAEQGKTSWWTALTPTAPMPPVLLNATVNDWHQGLDVVITASGTTASAVTLSATVSLSGGSAPGLYHLTVQESVAHGDLWVQAWQLTPTSG